MTQTEPLAISEILLALPTLSPAERLEIWRSLNELDGPFEYEFDEEPEISPEEIAFINARLDECERNPGSFIPWEVSMNRLKAEFGG